MASPNPIEVMLNMHSSSLCERYFVYHHENGTSPAYAILQQNFINGVRSFYPNAIEPYNYFVSWTSGTALQYPESWCWLNHGENIMAITYEDKYRPSCSTSGNYDSTANAILSGVMDYMNIEILPVELIAFTANYFQENIALNWTTATEINNQGFEIERSNDKSNWIAVGFKKGHGTTTENQNYSFTDDISNLNNNKFYYRLKQIDYSGTFEYSNIVEIVRTPTEFELQQNYPNPFNPSTSIQYALGSRQFVTIKIYNILGNEVATLVDEYKPAGMHNAEFRVENLELSSGIYFYRLNAADPSSGSGQGFVESKKMVLLK